MISACFAAFIALVMAASMSFGGISAGMISSGSVVMESEEPEDGLTPGDLKFISRRGEEEKVWLDGTYVESAAVQMMQYGDRTEYAVCIDFNQEGAELFAEATENLLGDILYIVLGEETLSAPRIMDVITGGSAVISGLKSLQEAEDLAEVLNKK